MVKVCCATCAEELLGAVNRCWRCGRVLACQIPDDGQPPVRRQPLGRLQGDPIVAELLEDAASPGEGIALGNVPAAPAAVPVSSAATAVATSGSAVTAAADAVTPASGVVGAGGGWGTAGVRRGTPFRLGARTQPYRELRGIGRLVLGRAPLEKPIAAWEWTMLGMSLSLVALSLLVEVTPLTSFALVIIAMILLLFLLRGRLRRVAVCLLLLMIGTNVWHGYQSTIWLQEQLSPAIEEE